MTGLSIHELRMKEVFALAQKAQGNTFPNPLVGCQIYHHDKLIATGYHLKAGEYHAERSAILNYEKEHGPMPIGCDLYVNLEPCSHHGRTPPCADIIVNRKFKTVYIAMQDPNPIVSGTGIEILTQAAIQVVTGVLTAEAEFLNRVYLKNQKLKRPYLSLKIATTMDGHMADQYGVSKWITGAAAREKVHRLRMECDGLLVGINTILIDNPALNIRINDKSLSNKIVVLDKTFKIQDDAKIFSENKLSDITIVIASENESSLQKKIKAFRAKQINIIVQACPNGYFGNALMHSLFEMGFCHLLVEAGPALISNFINQDLVDDFHLFMAPKILGNGNAHKHFSANIKLDQLKHAQEFSTLTSEVLGNDVYIHMQNKR